MKKLSPNLLKRIKHAVTLSEEGKEDRQTAVDYTFPKQFDRTVNVSLGKELHHHTSIPRGTVIKLQKNLKRFFVSKGKKLGKFAVGDGTDDQIAATLKDEFEIVWNTIIKGNYFEAAYNALRDMIVKGAGAINIYWCPLDKMVVYSYVPIDQLKWTYDDKGQLDLVVREEELKTKDAIAKYPKLIPLLKDDKKDLMESDKPVTIRKTTTMALTLSKKKGYTTYVDYKDDIIDERKNFPICEYIIFQWEANKTKSFSTSPVIDALGEIQALLRAARVLVVSCEVRAMPPAASTADSTSHWEWKPGVINKIDNAEDIPQTMDLSGNIPMTFQDFNLWSDIVHKAMFYFNPDLQRAQGVGDEFIFRAEEEFLNNIAHPSETLASQLTVPVIESSTKLLIINKMMEHVQNNKDNKLILDGEEITIEPSPGIKEREKRVSTLEKITDYNRYYAMTSQMQDPRAAAALNEPEAAVDILRGLSVDPNLINDNEKDRNRMYEDYKEDLVNNIQRQTEAQVIGQNT